MECKGPFILPHQNCGCWWHWWCGIELRKNRMMCIPCPYFMGCTVCEQFWYLVKHFICKCEGIISKWIITQHIFTMLLILGNGLFPVCCQAISTPKCWGICNWTTSSNFQCKLNWNFLRYASKRMSAKSCLFKAWCIKSERCQWCYISWSLYWGLKSFFIGS